MGSEYIGNDRYQADRSENRPATALAVPERPKHWFKPGNNANPGGRPYSLARYAREMTNDGRMLVEFMVTVALGNPVLRKRARAQRPSLKMQYDAVCWLADRGFGKVVQTTELRSDQPVTLIQLKWGDEGVGESGPLLPTSGNENDVHTAPHQGALSHGPRLRIEGEEGGGVPP